MSQKIKFGVIGQGHIGKRHAEMVRRNNDCELVAICDIKSKADLGVTGTEPFYTDVAEMLAKHPEIEVVNICTPNGLHASQALLALEASKHVVLEKPMALRLNDCEQLLYKALHKQKQIFCVMQNRFSPPSEWLKKVVSEKIIGDTYMVQLNCYWNRDERYYKPGNWKGNQELDGGTLFTQFSHFIDILYWVFGDITDIQAKFNDFKHSNLTQFEDSGMVNFRFVNGGMGALNYSTAVWDTNLESSLTVVGSKGSIKIGGQYMDKVEYCHIEGYTMPNLPPTNPANDYGAYKGSANNHHYVIQNVIDTLKGKSTITTNALEGLKVVDIIERIYSFRKADRKS
ncbi:MAG TPA: Gfo/Idh/MocA family oxidoreductase [Flavobacteriales bacterium]|nr:Gfo/Idh/MocA family oxidoreductase [Flavobacteriales bacterium]